jgi:hypothetical protein
MASELYTYHVGDIYGTSLYVSLLIKDGKIKEGEMDEE